MITIDGLLYYDGDSDDATLNPALNAAMLLERYVPIASNAERKVSYQVWNSIEVRVLIKSLFLHPSLELREESGGLYTRKELYV